MLPVPGSATGDTPPSSRRPFPRNRPAEARHGPEDPSGLEGNAATPSAGRSPAPQRPGEAMTVGAGTTVRGARKAHLRGEAVALRREPPSQRELRMRAHRAARREVWFARRGPAP